MQSLKFPFPVFSGRLLASFAISAILVGNSFAAAPKGNSKTPSKNEVLSEDEQLAKILESKGISADGKTMTDPRDGKKYSLDIRGQKVWMKSNLAFSISTPQQCLLGEETFCKKYGRFYIQAEAKKACPNGWHLPDDGEWRDYQKDREKLDWENLGKGGCKDWNNYCDSDATGHYWSASSVEKGTGRSWEFRRKSKVINRTDESNKKGLYVRCVTDLK